MTGRALAVSVVLLGLGAGAPACAPSGESEPRPNVVMILLDTLRADHLELYGYAKATAPFVASLGPQSAVFDNAFSTSSWTCPSTASLFTGAYPTRSGVTTGFFAHHRRGEASDETLTINRLPAGVATLPEQLRELGYRTYGVGTNINIGAEVGFDRGFDRFQKLHNVSAAQVVAQVLDWSPGPLSPAETAPFFLYLHLNDVHGPYRPRAPWYEDTGDEQSNTRSAYDSEIRATDGVIASLLERIDPEDRAVVVILSDHGEEFWDHGQLGHKFSLHNELNQVVWLLRAPGLGVLPGRYPQNVSLVDVVPTLIELLGGIPAAGDGLSLAALLRGGDSAAALRERLTARPVFAHRRAKFTPDELWSVVHDRYRLIVGPGGTALYDREADRAELVDLAATHPEIVASLSGEIERLRALPPLTGTSGVEVPLDEATLDALRELGYVDLAP